MRRINQIKGMIFQAHKKDKGVDEEKLIAMLGFEWGTARRLIHDYLKVLESNEIIERVKTPEGKMIFVKQKLIKEQTTQEALQEADEVFKTQMPEENSAKLTRLP